MSQNGHGPFANAEYTTRWLREHVDGDIINWDGLAAEETIFWDSLVNQEEETIVFQAYERILREQVEEAAEPTGVEGPIDGIEGEEA